MNERRKFQRYTDKVVEIRMKALGNGTLFDASLKDVSIGGIKVRTNEAVDMYGFYTIDIVVSINGQNQKVSAEGKVWRIEPDTELNDDKSRFVALEFTCFSQGDKALFSKFLAGFVLNNDQEENLFTACKQYTES